MLAPLIVLAMAAAFLGFLVFLARGTAERDRQAFELHMLALREREAAARAERERRNERDRERGGERAAWREPAPPGGRVAPEIHH